MGPGKTNESGALGDGTSVAFTPVMNTTSKILALAIFSSSSLAMAAESFPLPQTDALVESLESPDAALDAITYEASWDSTLDELTAADRLVVVAASVGEKILLDPGFKVANVEVEDLWITDVEIARRGKGVVLHPTQEGTTHLFVADADGWVLEYEIKVEGGVESAELEAYEVDETSAPQVASASIE